MKASTIYSTLSNLAKRLEKDSGTTLNGFSPTLIVRLHCGCIMTELVNEPRTRTFMDFSRHPTCEKLSHFTGEECGWPQLEDAVKATTLPLDAWSGKLGDPVKMPKNAE